MKIEEIDKNFVSASLNGVEVIYRDVKEQPFAIEGFGWFDKNPKYYRIPPEMTEEQCNAGVMWLATSTAGGAVRFRTDSQSIALRAKLYNSSDMNHMPRLGSSGFDMYRGEGAAKVHFASAQVSTEQLNETLELMLVQLQNAEPGMHEWTLNMPLYGGVEKIEIGVLPGSTIEAPTPHAVKDPVLFYGSSITQGGCASRPGNAYTSMLCRAVDAPQINLGFSGSGRGEPTIAEAIASLKLSCFIMDYDHNAPTPEHLEATHENFFRIIREKNPSLPVIFMTKCDTWNDRPENYAIDLRRREIIRKTYENAKAAGDKNVYFINGEILFGTDNRHDCTVDRCHPNDLGFYRMYTAVLPVLKQALTIN